MGKAEEQLRTVASKQKMLTALKNTLGIVTSACEKAEISRTQFYQWLKDDEDFAKEVKDFENIALDFAETSLLKNIKDGKESSTIFYLKTKGKGRGYIESKHFDHTSGGEKIEGFEYIVPDDETTDKAES